VIEAKEVWEKKLQPSNFMEFVQVREQSGEDLRLHKAVWSKNKTSTICQLCSDQFSLTNRRHHCRACGVLTCDKCSSKRLHLTMSANCNSNSTDPPAAERASNSFRNSFRAIGGGGSSAANTNTDSGSDRKKGDDGSERVCDGCFNRLCQEASQPSPDHFRVRQLKQCALDLIHTIEELIDSLDDPGKQCDFFLSFFFNSFLFCF
jgi:DNA-directed RNA polymerase subunit RPC12/RpoP